MDSRIFFKVNYSVDCALVINIYRCTFSLKIMTQDFEIIILIILLIIKTIIWSSLDLQWWLIQESDSIRDILRIKNLRCTYNPEPQIWVWWSNIELSMIQSSRESIIDVSEMLDKCFLKAVLSKLYRPVKSVPGETLDERVINQNHKLK